MAREVEKLVSIPTQRYDVPSGRIGNRFFVILSVELDGIQNCQWNEERVIVFQTVILQRISGVSGSRNIRDRIDSQTDLWNKGAHNELVQDSHRAAEEALGNKRGNQTQEQHHCTISNLKKREIARSRSFYL